MLVALAAPAAAQTVPLAPAQEISGDRIAVPATHDDIDPAARAMTEWERFVYDRTQRMTVPVRINGAEAVPFIIDTGSERTVISRELAMRLTLPPALAMRLATVSGPIMAASYRIDHLANGGFAAEHFDAPALERRNLGVDGLIGIESLKDKTVIFDFAGQRIQVLPSRTTPMRVSSREDAIIVTAKRKNGRLILSDAQVMGRRIDLVIDTGSQGSVGNLALRRMLASRTAAADASPASLIDVTGTTIPSEANTVPEITFGDFTLARLPIVYADNYALAHIGLSGRPAMLLGMDALAMFDRVEIDFRRRKIKFVMPQGAERAIKRTRLPSRLGGVS